MGNTSIRIPLSGTGSGSTAWGNSYVRSTRFESIGSLTSGALTLPPVATVILDDFGGTVDAVVSKITGGKPNFQPAESASGEIITTSLDASGNWVLSSAPSSYPVAIIYRVRQLGSDFDYDATNIIGNATVESTTLNIQLFLASGTYYKPVGPNGQPLKLAKTYALGAGGQGAAGRKGAAGTVRCGGGGGAGGAFVIGEFDGAIIPDTVTVTIGAGGTSNNGQSTNSTNGSNGVDGGGTTFGNLLKANGGGRGRGGTNATGAGGSLAIGQVTPWNFLSIPGAAASTTGGVGTTPSASSFLSPAGGASGGGITSGDSASNGAIGGNLTSSIVPAISLVGGAAGGAAPANASDGSSAALFTGFLLGSGGGSSRASLTGNSGNGGAGGRGAGGGGSGAVVDSTGNSGNGGAGGDGLLMVVGFF